MYKPYTQKHGENPEKKPTAKKLATQQQQVLQELFWAELAEIRDAVYQLTKAWPLLTAAATSGLLKEFLTECHVTNSIHFERLKKISTVQGSDCSIKNCTAVKSIIGTIQNFSLTDDADTLIEIAAQKLLHYLAACYDGLVMMACTIHPTAAAPLNEMLTEIKNSNHKLFNISMPADAKNSAA